MKVESSIKENCVSTTQQPITDSEECIKAICEWNGILIDEFREIVWPYKVIWTDSDNKYIYALDDVIIDPIGIYLSKAYNNKLVVFEKDNDKFFGKLDVRAETTRYALWDKVIEIAFRIKAVNEDTEEGMIIFPKKQDIIQPRMKCLYVINTGWAERQRIEKEIIAKLIDLAMVRGWNEIVQSQNTLEELKEKLKKRDIELELCPNGKIYLSIPWRMVRDTSDSDSEYPASPIKISIDFENKEVKCLGYSSHWFGTPTSWGNPCWWNWQEDITNNIRDCDLKWLINLVISWAYGYNSRDTGTHHSDRHPLAKLRDYIWRMCDHKEQWERVEDRKALAEQYPKIKQYLEMDSWIEDNPSIKSFLSELVENNETKTAE